MKLSLNGKSHRVMRLMQSGPVTADEMETELALSDRKKRRKLWFLLLSLREAGLIETDGEAHRITRDGLQALRVLDAGEVYEPCHQTGNARTFEVAA